MMIDELGVDSNNSIDSFIRIKTPLKLTSNNLSNWAMLMSNVYPTCVDTAALGTNTSNLPYFSLINLIVCYISSYLPA